MKTELKKDAVVPIVFDIMFKTILMDNKEYLADILRKI